MNSTFLCGFELSVATLAVAVVAAPLMAEVPSGRTGGLPRAYQRLEYVASSSGQYVRTGIIPNGRMPTVHLKYLLSKTNGKYVFGYWDHFQNAGTAVGWNNSQFWLRTYQESAGYDSWNDKVNEVDLNTPTGTYVNCKLASGVVANFKDSNSTREYCLMGRTYVGDDNCEIVEPASCRLYEARISLDGEVVRDFVPCLRMADLVAGLYDFVEGKFYVSNTNVPLDPGPISGVDNDWYQIAPIGSSRWISASDGPHPEVRNAATGRVLTEGTDYLPEWYLSAAKPNKGMFRVIGLGENEGHDTFVEYEATFDHDTWWQYFTPVNGLVSDGKAIIKTGIAPTGSVPVVRLKYRLPAKNDCYFIGYWSQTEQAGAAVGWHDSKFWFRVWKTSAGYGSFDGEDHVVELNTPTGTYVDGKLASEEIKGLRDDSVCEYYLMGRAMEKDSVVTAEPCACTLYSAKIWLDEKLVRDFVPVKLTTGSFCGLYDRVTGRIFENASGDGRFACGAALRYQVSPIGVSPWRGEKDGPHPEVRIDSSGALLSEGTDYRLEWRLLDNKEATVRIIGLGEYEGRVQSVSYEPSFGPGNWRRHFRQVEYLESDGKAFIKTGIAPTGSVPVVLLKYRLPAKNDRYLIGYWSQTEQGGTAVGWHDSKFWFRVWKTSAGYGSLDGGDHVVELNTPTGTYVDGKLASEAIKGLRDDSVCEYYLMGRAMEKNSVVTAEPCACRLYSAKIWIDGELVRDFIPVRTGTGNIYEYGFYDQVTGRFFRNAANTGAFTVGPDVKRTGLCVMVF